MAIEVSYQEEISGGGENGEGIGVSSIIHQKRAIIESVNIKKRE